MWVLPYEKFTLTTHLSPDEVIQAVKSTIFLPNGQLLKDYDVYATKYFTGYINGLEFEVTQNAIRSSKTPLPIIKGKISQINDGAKIYIRIFSIAQIAMMCFAICFLFIAGVAINLRSVHHNYIPFIMLIFAYFIIMLPFKTNCDLIRSNFRDILNG